MSRFRVSIIGLPAFAFAGLLFAAAADGGALHRITFGEEGQAVRTVEGEILVEAVDGGLLVLGRDGALWNITPGRLTGREEAGEAFQPLSADELGRQLKAELGDGFEVLATEHYVICTNAGPAYARWCGTLFERLLTAFRKHWSAKPLELREPAMPLVAIVFAGRDEFARYAAKDAGADAASAAGYYSIRTNRMVLFDLTDGMDGRPRTPEEISRKLAASAFNVATVVHEATHQIAFNCGLHTRYADNPLWLTEGMAMYFETPDLRNRTGWQTAGRINPPRYRRFAEYVRGRRKADSLATLLSSDGRFTDPDSAADAYAEAWALTYFLIRTKRRAYTEYLERISKKPRLVWNKPDERLAEFQAAFGDDLPALDRQFLRYMARAGRR